DPRCRGESLHCAVRRGKRDVAQRVLEEAPHCAGTKSQDPGTGCDHRKAKIRNGGSHRNGERAGIANPEGERRARAARACAANGPEQSVKGAPEVKGGSPAFAVLRRGRPEPSGRLKSIAPT